MLTPTVIYAELVAARFAGQFGFAGYPFDQLAWLIAYAVSAWFKEAGVTLTGVAVGTAGVGAINVPASKLTLAPNTSRVISGLQSAGMNGPFSVSLGTVVAIGLAKAVTTYGQYAGSVAGVGVGGDVSKVATANAPSLVAQLKVLMASMLGPGAASAQMATGLGTGIAALALTLTGAGSVVGSPSISPGAGSSTSVVV